MRVNKKIGIGCLVLALVVLSPLLWVIGSSYHAARMAPPLVVDLANIGGPWANMDNAFRSRVFKKFHVGMPSQDLRFELERQGFLVSGPRNDAVGYGIQGLSDKKNQANWTWMAERQIPQDNLIVACNLGAKIVWNVDAKGFVTAIESNAGERGCL